MSILSIPPLVMAGIAFYVGAYHLLVYLRQTEQREHLTFALLCWMIGSYDIACTGLYNAASVGEGASWQRAQAILLALATTAFLWFVADYVSHKPTGWLLAFSAYFGLAAAAGLVDRSSLTWLADHPAIKVIHLPAGLEVTYYGVAPGLLTDLLGIMTIAAFVYAFVIGAGMYRGRQPKKARTLLLAMVLFFVAVLNDIAVTSGLYAFIYLIEYAYMSMVLLMAYSLSEAVVEAAMTKEAFRKSEERLSLALEAASDGLFDWNLHTGEVYFSPRWYTMLGYDFNELAPSYTTWRDLLHPDDVEYAESTVIRGYFDRKRASHEVEFRMRTKAGGWKWILSRAKVVEWGAGGQPIRMVGTHVDITERKEMENALAGDRNLLRTLIDTVPDLIFIKDTQSRFLTCNMTMTRLLGAETPDEIVGKTDFDFSDQEMAAHYLADEQALFQSGQPLLDHEEVGVDPTGAPKWYLTTKAPLRDTRGSIVGLVGVCRDITNRKRVDEALRALIGTSAVAGVDFLHSLVKHLAGALQVKYALIGELVDPLHEQLHVISVWDGDQFGEPFEYHLHNSPYADVMSQGFCFYPDSIRQRFPHDAVLQQTGAESYMGMSLFDSERKPLGLLAILHDQPILEWKESESILTIFAARAAAELERIHAERQIRQLNVELEQRVHERTAQLEATNQELEAFAYSVSHDLRAPLRAISGFSGILLEDYAAQLPPEAQRYLHEVQTGAQQMGQLIGDLLTFSRLSRQPLTKQLLSPAHLVRQALAELSAEQENRQVEISIGELPACQADPKLLKQVWVNLLANALKFTRRCLPARIEVGCQSPPQGGPVYYVKDNGVGFDMRYAHKLFGVFQRLHRAEEFEGAGAGLAIVQRIVQRHGGRIWAEAQVNQGATFYFTL